MYSMLARGKVGSSTANPTLHAIAERLSKAVVSATGRLRGTRERGSIPHPQRGRKTTEVKMNAEQT